MKELVVISGKGGTGKTSIAASLAVLAGGAGQCRVATIVAVEGDLYVGGGFDSAGDGSVVGMGGIARFGPRSGGSLYLPIAGDD